ncbi:MAG TPA: hypothetical protein VK908_18080 [Jiangellales bacterium]|nr:hypothetical protein [Jiangellales bacterium]
MSDLSALVRVDIDPSLPFLMHGGSLEAGAFVVVGVLAFLWIRYTRGVLTVDLDGLDLEDPKSPTAEPR